MTTADKEREELIEELTERYDLCDCTGGWSMSMVELADFILARQAKLVDEVQKAVQEECRGGINVDGMVREQKLMEENAKLREDVEDLERSMRSTGEDCLCQIRRANNLEDDLCTAIGLVKEAADFLEIEMSAGNHSIDIEDWLASARAIMEGREG